MSLQTLRTDTLRVLREWMPLDTEQNQLRETYVDFVNSFDNSVDRSCRVGHVTASGLLVDTTTGEVLLTLHARIGRWLQLGGHIEPETDSSLLDAALRECREESGIDSLTIDPVPLRLDRHEVPCSDGLGGRSTLHHWDVQFLVLTNNRSHVISDESADLAWFPPESLPQVDASVVALVGEARKRLSGH
jgi:8-oxo-dGTP pyrophosphatase MutT (NUDIX family)